MCAVIVVKMSINATSAGESELFDDGGGEDDDDGGGGGEDDDDDLVLIEIKFSIIFHIILGPLIMMNVILSCVMPVVSANTQSLTII